MSLHMHMHVVAVPSMPSPNPPLLSCSSLHSPYFPSLSSLLPSFPASPSLLLPLPCRGDESILELAQTVMEKLQEEALANFGSEEMVQASIGLKASNFAAEEEDSEED